MGNFVLHFLLKMCTIKEEIQTERNRRDDMVVHEFSDREALRIAAEANVGKMIAEKIMDVHFPAPSREKKREKE